MPSNNGRRGRPPHLMYRRIREKAEEIIRLRDDLKWSDNRCALTLGFGKPSCFNEVYCLLKENAQRLVEHNDWKGVEAVLYARFPDYESDPRFRILMMDFNDPRVQQGGYLEHAPLAPVRPKPATVPPLPVPPPFTPGIPPAVPPAFPPADSAEPSTHATKASPEGGALSEPAPVVQSVPAPQKRWGRQGTPSSAATPSTAS